MKKQHPDEDAIPTLNDLVFPGDSERRPTPQSKHERVDPQLDSQVLESEAPAPKASKSDPEPIELPSENENTFDEWEYLLKSPTETQESPDVDLDAQESSPHSPAFEIEHDIDGEDDSEHSWSEHPLHLNDESDHQESSRFDDASLSRSNATSAELVIEDLPSDSNEPHELHDVLDDAPREQEEQVPSRSSPIPLSTAPNYELVRAAVRKALESEIDSLTDMVTDAVIARLRE